MNQDTTIRKMETVTMLHLLLSLKELARELTQALILDKKLISPILD